MRITRVELTNIKSYASAAIDLREGVTAIRGHNGAGKSTLLEAVGWALFDYISYKQADFVREGENNGKVTVTFISPLDDRAYEVTRRCGNRSEWFIFDPTTGLRIDSTKDVKDFLKQHMRLEGTIELPDLFRSALGAPQGTLTADFLDSPTNRKKKFDALLQVEDYRTAQVELGKTVSYLKERIGEQDVRIVGLERDAAQLDAWKRERDSARVTQRETTQSLHLLATQLETVEVTLAQLRQAEAEVAQRESEAALAQATHAAAQQRLGQAASLRDESRAAAQILTETRADHEGRQRAERERAHAQRRAHERDDLRAQHAEAARANESAQSDARNALAQLQKIEEADQLILALLAPQDRQFELERQRDEARNNSKSLREAQQRLHILDEQCASTKRTVAECEREIAQIEPRRAAAQALDDRRGQVERLQALAAQREQYEQQRERIDRERAERASERGAAQKTQAQKQQNLRKLEGFREIAEALGERERAWQTLEKRVSQIEAKRAQHLDARKLSGAGDCPFLREPCKNIQQRGENNLAVYFDRLIADDDHALASAQAERDAAYDLAAESRRVAEHYNNREEFGKQLKAVIDQLAALDAKDAQATAERDEIERKLALAGDLNGLGEAKRLLRESQEADKTLATLPTLRKRLAEHEELLARLAKEQAALEALQAEYASAPAVEQAAEAELARLGDPHSKIVGLRALTATRPEVQQRLDHAERARRQHEAALARLADSLAPYATLDAEINTLDAEIKRMTPGHTRYLQHEQAAGRLPEREQEHAEATTRVATAASAAQAAAQALAQARSHFDANALADANTRANDLRTQHGRLRETLRQAEAMLETLERDIARGEERLADLERARVERAELTDSLAMLEQFRKIIGEAGPLVTNRLLEQISAQANEIFGEIIGDRSAHLAWVGDYEIQLRRGSTKRTFAMLSGGEQMAAALATRLALLRRLTGLDLAFFDEPTQNMDSERRSALAEQIRRVRGFEQLIVISHDDTFEQGLDSVIHLEKRDGATVVCDDSATFGAAPPFTVEFSAYDDPVAVRGDASLSALLTD